MDPTRATRLITAAGGDIAFAQLLGLDVTDKGVQQRVNNWKRRGLPNAIIAAHYERLKELEEQADRAPRRGDAASTATHGR